MIRRTLPGSAVAEEPHLVWNAFVDLLAMSDYAELSPQQRAAHLAFWYDSEVQNGGHYQYFENPAGRRCAETVVALQDLELGNQASVLRRAIRLWESRERVPAITADEFVEDGLDKEFDELDSAYHECTPTIVEALGVLLKAQREQFVVIDESA